MKTLLTSSVENLDAKKIRLSNSVINSVNKISSVPFYINVDVLKIVTSKIFYPFVSDET